MSTIKRYAKREHDNFTLLLIARYKFYSARAKTIQADTWTSTSLASSTSGRLDCSRRHWLRNNWRFNTTTKSKITSANTLSYYSRVLCSFCVTYCCSFTRSGRSGGQGSANIASCTGIRPYEASPRHRKRQVLHRKKQKSFFYFFQFLTLLCECFSIVNHWLITQM